MLILEGHTGPVLSVAYAPDSRTLASGGADQSVRLWDITTGRQSLVIHDPGGPVVSLAFAPDGNTLAVGTSHCVTLWDLARAEPGPTFEGGDRPGTYVVAFAPDSRVAVAAGFLDPHLTVWDTVADRYLAALEGHRAGVLAVAHAPRDPLLVTGGGIAVHGELFVWDMITYRLRAKLEERLRVSVANHWFDVQHGHQPPAREVEVMAAHTQAVYSVAVSPDGRLVASGGKDRVAKLWEVEAGRVRHTLPGHGGTVIAVSFPPDGRTLLTADEAGVVRLWDVETGRLRCSWDWEVGKLRSVVFAPNGMTAAAGGGDHRILVWDVDALDA